MQIEICRDEFMAKLGDYANFIMGQAPASSECNSNGVGTPFVKAGKFGLSTPVMDEWTTNPLKMASNKDILICVVGATSGKLNRGVECAIGRSVAAIRPNEKTIRDYIYYGLHPWIKRLRGGSQGSAIGVITKDMLDAVEMPFPEKERQKEIVKTLSLIENIIEKRKEELKKFDTLIKARFVEMFGDLNINPKGWVLKPFDELTYLITDGEHSTPRRSDKGIYLLSARNVLNHALQLEDVDYIDEEEYERIARRIIPQAGDVLLSCSGTVGRCCCVPDGLKFQMVRSTAILRFKEELNPVFAEYMIASDYVQKQIDKSKTASSQANLFQGKIAKLKGFVPPRALQDEFLLFVEQVNKSKFVFLI